MDAVLGLPPAAMAALRRRLTRILQRHAAGMDAVQRPPQGSAQQQQQVPPLTAATCTDEQVNITWVTSFADRLACWGFPTTHVHHPRRLHVPPAPKY